MDSLIFKLKVFKFSLKTVLGLFSASNLLVQAFNGFFSFRKTGRQFLLASLKLINSAKSFSLKLGSPQLDFSLGLRQSLKGIRLLLRLLFNALPQVLQLSIEILELGKKGRTVTSLRISQTFGVFQLSGQ